MYRLGCVIIRHVVSLGNVSSCFGTMGTQMVTLNHGEVLEVACSVYQCHSLLSDAQQSSDVISPHPSDSKVLMLLSRTMTVCHSVLLLIQTLVLSS